MKFLPENRKKLIWSIVLLVISTAGIVYVNFFTGTSNKTVVTSEQINQAFSNTPPTSVGVGASVSSEVTGGLLPHGSKINPRILNDEKFKILKAFARVIVDPSLLGKPNLFERQ